MSFTSRKRARRGDVVTIDFKLTPVDGFVPLPLFDSSGEISFVLGWGNYLPGLHDLVETMKVGQERHDVILDAGWGSRNRNLVVKISKNKLTAVKDHSRIKVGTILHLQGGIQVEVIQVMEDSIVVDANPPLAGASYSCDVKLLAVESIDSRYEAATFALGCYWGGELAFMRVPGVVGTKVGYTQGIQRNPTYEQVCTGETKHREAVHVVFDPSIVTYESLARIALDRLAWTTLDFQLSKLFNNDVIQYKHGFYYHSEEQRVIAQELLGKDNNKYHVELLAAAEFYDAEDSHQQYLLKGGQSAKKGSQDTIRCFG
jgi:peptide-methionine (S)-S-oxide reductase